MEIHAAVPLCVHHSLEGEHVHALRSRERGCFLVVQTLWAVKIQSTTDAGSLNTFGRNEIEVAPISLALLRIECLVILYKSSDQELTADGGIRTGMRNRARQSCYLAMAAMRPEQKTHRIESVNLQSPLLNKIERGRSLLGARLPPNLLEHGRDRGGDDAHYSFADFKPRLIHSTPLDVRAHRPGCASGVDQSLRGRTAERRGHHDSSVTSELANLLARLGLPTAAPYLKTR